MKMIGQLLGMGLFGLLLAGCIEQEVKIKLNADGSGSLVLTRYLSDMESGAMLMGEEEPPSFDALTVVRQSVHDAAGQSMRKIQTAEYTFSHLGEALPELESLVPMMPRFCIQENVLNVSVSHEMNPNHGFSSEDQTNAFYHLEIEFPVPPKSETGLVEGNRVVWKADYAQLKAFQKSKIGTGLFECSIPAASIRLNLKPRLVKTENAVLKKLKEQKKVKLISALDLQIPIISAGHRWKKEDSNATLDLYLPVDPGRLPLCYEGLTLGRLTIDGQTVAPELVSESAGVFSGTDAYGKEAPGIPIKFKFGWNAPLLHKIDVVNISMQAAVPTKTSLHSLEVDAGAVTNSILNFPGSSGKRIAALKLDHSFSQTAKLKLVTNLNPTDVSMVYLDTTYGLRYPAKGINWKCGKNIYGKDRSLGEAVFGKDCEFSILELHYPHIPTTSFRLVFSRIEVLEMKELILLEENIDVY